MLIIRTTLVLVLLYSFSICHGQWVNQKTFGNEWIDFSKNYVSVQVTSTGIQRLKIEDLPPPLKATDPDRFQLWHRGKEVRILEANKEEILFYGVTNDGASDSLLYRPFSARLNPHVSFFSDIGYYFLTHSDSPAKRIDKVDTIENGSSSGSVISSLTGKFIKSFTDQFSFPTFGTSTLLNNSFYEASNSWTGTTIAGDTGTSVKNTVSSLKLNLVKFDASSNLTSQIELLVMGLSSAEHLIRVEASPDGINWRLLAKADFSGWTGQKLNAPLETRDVSETGDLYLKFYSSSGRSNDWFSVSYLSIEYPKKLIYDSEQNEFYHFPPELLTDSRIQISNTSPGSLVFDITDSYDIKQFSGIQSGESLEIYIPGLQHRSPDLLITSKGQFNEIEAERIKYITFSPIYSYNGAGIENVLPENFDYFIITTPDLKNGALEYAEYRASESGGSFRVLVIDINTIYSLYNYGEPSPVAIKAFMKHMLSKGVRPKVHNLLLLGSAVTYPPRILKELPNELPSFGDPASDLLLVAGLADAHQDTPAIPVGRVKAFQNSEILSYLNKVREYEHESSDIFWRKRALHISGGATSSEITVLGQILSSIAPTMERSPFAGRVTSKIKSTTAPIEKINISKEINEGIGVLTFFGHGSQTVIDMDLGYASDVSRGYENSQKYPFMYFNGCGVGNIFTSREVHILTDDWLIAPNKGAIVILANSYKSYVTPSTKHISTLYDVLFNDYSVQTIGEIWKKTAETIVGNSPNSYDVANVHQVCLQGDPAIQLFRIAHPDYIASKGNIFLHGEDTTPLAESNSGKLAVIIKNGGKYIENQNIPLKVVYHYNNGLTKESNLDFNSVAFQDTVWVSVENLNNHLYRIEVLIDPGNTINEFTKSNNIADLVIDWNSIEPGVTLYPNSPLVDQVSPTISLMFNGKELPDKSRIDKRSFITLILEDDQSMNEDKSRIEIYLKACWDDSCDFILLNPDEYDVDILSSTKHKFSFQLPENVQQEGVYQLLVIGYDEFGNKNGTGLIRNFEIPITSDQEENRSPHFIVSPNPSNSYIKFRSNSNLFFENALLTWKIFNMRGEKVNEQSRDLTNTFLNEWYFDFRNNSGLLSSGIYFYDIQIKPKEGTERKVFNQRGKFIIQR